MAEVTQKSSQQIALDTLGSSFVINWFSIIILGVLISGHLVWIFERGNAMFPLSLQDGGHQGVWCAVITVTTVGFGDKVPRTGWGRIVCVGWMTVGFVATACVVGSIASALVGTAVIDNTAVKQEGLSGTKVCTVVQYAHHAEIQSYSPHLVPGAGIEP